MLFRFILRRVIYVRCSIIALLDNNIYEYDLKFILPFFQFTHKRILSATLLFACRSLHAIADVKQLQHQVLQHFCIA